MYTQHIVFQYLHIDGGVLRQIRDSVGFTFSTTGEQFEMFKDDRLTQLIL